MKTALIAFASVVILMGYGVALSVTAAVAAVAMIAS